MRGNQVRGAVTGLSIILGALPAMGHADVPDVAADIPPVHSLVSQVMGGLGTPALLVRPGASPHGYALRPSEAEALERADAVFWIGDALEPWLESAIGTLAPAARVTELAALPETLKLEQRQGATFEAHDHAHEETHGQDGSAHHDAETHDHDHEDHDHDAHDHGGHDHDHEAHDHGQDAHDHDHAEHHHHHGGSDPHVWLDPVNARLWLSVIAEELSVLDPENAAIYRANAADAAENLDLLIDEISTRLAPARELNFIVFHDAYQYFEARFGVPAEGSITVSDASDPSAARIQQLQAKVRDLGITCAFSEPQFNPGLVEAVFEGTAARTGVMDPLGAALQPGPDLYPALLRGLADSLSACLD